MLPTMFWGGKQVKRLPIGTEESLKTFSHDALSRFYQDWYRPDLCTLVVVGDIPSPEEMEQYIQTTWESGHLIVIVNGNAKRCHWSHRTIV